MYLMEKLSIQDIIRKIENSETFNAVAADYSFSLKIDSYVHYVCAAVHDGHQFRKALWAKCLHSEYERWYEEDPETKSMIKDHPIVLAGRDSRFEYDLNRSPEEAVFETAWGKALWKVPLNTYEKDLSLKKHQGFYRVVYTLLMKLESIHKTCIVYDMHSYNWKRWDREVPTWNLGTKNIDNPRFGNLIEEWRSMLSDLLLPNDIRQTAAINNTFYGNGYFLKFITGYFNNTLVLATEIAKIYCDEYSQIIYPEVVNAICEQLKLIIPEHADLFKITYNV